MKRAKANKATVQNAMRAGRCRTVMRDLSIAIAMLMQREKLTAAEEFYVVNAAASAHLASLAIACIRTERGEES